MTTHKLDDFKFMIGEVELEGATLEDVTIRSPVPYSTLKPADLGDPNTFQRGSDTDDEFRARIKASNAPKP